MRKKLVFKILLLICLALLIDESNLSAEFLETRAGVYQNTSLREKIIVSYDEPGIFLFIGTETDVQLFDEKSLQLDKSEHCFISYDPAENRYNYVDFGGKRFNIQGNLSLEMSSVRIGIDNSNPYLTIALKNANDIIGFKGLQEVVNKTGGSSVTLLEANTLSEFSNLIVPYKYSNSELKLRNNKISTSKTLGLQIRKKKNPCSSEDKSIIIEDFVIEKLNKIKNTNERKKKLSSILKTKEKLNMLSDSLLIATQDSSIITLDYTSGVLRKTRPLQKSLNNKTICISKKIDL